MKKTLLGLALLLASGLSTAQAAPTTEQALQKSWDEVVKLADGQTVYFNAWGGSQEINDYLRWAGRQLQVQYGVSLKHVKVADIAETTQRLLAEKAAGKNEGGSVDLVWINGENFRSMKHSNLLYGPFTQQLPNWQYVDTRLPIDEDFTEPTAGLEAPWGVGQLVFIHDKETLNNPPKNFAELLSLAKAYPGKVSYPQPPEFHGSSFLKAALLELTNKSDSLYTAIDSQAERQRFEQVTAPLWRYLDQLHPVAWQQGKRFPSGTSETIQLLDDQQLLLAITFNPNAANAAIENGNLVETAQAYAFEQGALSNIHFLAIPWNAQAKAGALVTINFLMSPEAQARKADAKIWGDPSVLKPESLTHSGTQGFSLFKSIAEPHPSWLTAIELEWQKRYGS
ncbi:ABC transporter substrate-binding protein [Photobacterium sp. DNB23_23_1]|uniref:ABC transporter substrate-binding protein n=1 Tax=Photobacterium pectinilyticum TaxID=2906793 RepID=A0ABT1N161_9GAMM|nr:ABC transporter substrate-binding protein [Photobacterium sp. ZSDE20]MCQ1058468.1 ABC transporter substrate-binding protein [Photobacterium sp. ZSDE20]MDD1823191.1 ABC transporter substrate-binding protein [Photobacterium sp. ZSDE20]